ncbi:MAG: FecR family protein [Pseudobacter sp.]|uniref:FecR family protein n=1 Tax=Pseudobacter sp. TaxID=2045420 RepID=UPI003F8091F3
MHDASSRLKDLYERYLADQCSAAERNELMTAIAENKSDTAFHSLIDATFEDPLLFYPLSEEKAEELFLRIRKKNRAKIILLPARKWWAAAIVLLIVIAGGWYLNQQPATVNNAVAVQMTDSISQADHSGAILILADGRKLNLDEQEKGLIATENGSSVEMTGNGVVYDQNAASASVAYNTMTTPKGKQFRLRLPDGTEVELNAASSIRYPVSFQGNEREVYLEGEAWFNVKSDPAKPFRVKMPGQAAFEVLGTAFNLRCYAEEPVMKATLLSGKIRFVQHEYRKLLSPGQQLQQDRTGAVKIMQAVDTSQVMAWKNGEFSFRRMPLEEAIRELARWYDLEPVFTGELPAFEFYGSMGRGLSPQQVVKLLNNMGLHASLDNNRLIISR